MANDYKSLYSGKQIDRVVCNGQSGLPRVVVTRRIPCSVDKWERGKNLRLRFSTNPTFVIPDDAVIDEAPHPVSGDIVTRITIPGLHYLEGIIHNLYGDSLYDYSPQRTLVRTKYNDDSVNCIKWRKDGKFQAVRIEYAETTRPGFVIRAGKIVYEGVSAYFYAKTMATGRKKKLVKGGFGFDEDTKIGCLKKWRWAHAMIGPPEGHKYSIRREVFKGSMNLPKFGHVGLRSYQRARTSREFGWEYYRRYDFSKKRPYYYNKRYIEIDNRRLTENALWG